ncbi:MAG: ABC transporter ATP-binding protein/permease [Symbiobacteriaceae bacterium]|nr:ABC transporter ATP-binding protein/permease [Symbiobacteriaceae bacterium]
MTNGKKNTAWSNYLYIMGSLLTWDKALLPWMILRIFCMVASPVLLIFMPRVLIDAMISTGESLEGTVFKLTLISFGLMVANILLTFTEQRIQMGGVISQNRFVWLYTHKVLTVDYAYLESHAGQMAREKAVRAIEATYRGAGAIAAYSVWFAGHLLSLIAYCYIVADLHILVFLGLLAGSLISYLISQKARDYETGHIDGYILAEKQRYYSFFKIHEFTSTKDIRLFAMQKWLMDTMLKYLREQKSCLTNIRMRYFASDTGTLVVNLIRDTLVYIYLTTLVIQGQITLGEYSLLFAAVAGISGWLNLLLQDYSQFNIAQREVGFLRDYLDYATDQGLSSAAADSGAAEQLELATGAPEIIFEDISFCYPGSDMPVLHDFSLTIHRGEKMALVGLNGAGKTTCVKLLLGLYRPSTGRILIDGQDTATMPKERLYAFFAPVFQDIWVLPLDIARNVSGQNSEATDRARVHEVLQQAGLAEKIASLPLGIDTALTRALDDEGINLSGGETQKLMLARALYKTAPITVMDEPTAALDPLAEEELYKSYDEIVRDKTALYISHRLSSTRFCDRIAFLSEGSVKEAGTHEELLAAGGSYAELFLIQSKYYQDDFSYNPLERG